MDTGTLAKIARNLGAVEVREKAGKITCSCLLARWTHSGAHDTKPSMVIFPSGRKGDPIYKCLGCHEEGSLRELTLDIWAATGRSQMTSILLIDGDSEGAAKAATASSRFASWDDNGPKKEHKAWGVELAAPKIFDDGKPYYSKAVLVEADSVPEIPADVYAPYLGSIPAYAIKRGLTIETCKTWELGHDPDGKRLLFPIRDRAGRLVAISGRLYAKNCVFCGGAIARGVIKDGKKVRDTCKVCGKWEPPKYLHSDGFKRNLVLYGEHRKQDDVDGNVFLVEGHLDMILMWQAGYRLVVAMLGSYPGRCQIEKLIAYWGRAITVVPDGDKAGASMAAKVKQLVAGRVAVLTRELPDGADPGSLTREQMRECIGEPTFAVD